jgi:hypothetical protein
LRTQIGASVQFSSTVRKQVEMLEDHSDFAANFVNLFQVRGQFHAIDNDASDLMLFQAVDAPDHRRLAGSRRPADDDALFAQDLKVDVAQDVKIAVPLVDVRELDCNRRVELRRLEQRSMAVRAVVHRRSPFVSRASMARAYRDMP